MGNSQVVEVVNVKQAAPGARAGLLSSPLAQVALLTAMIFAGATAAWGLEFGLRVALLASAGPMFGLHARRWWDRARERQSFSPLSRAEHLEERRRNLPAYASATVMTLGALFTIVTALGGFELAARVMAPLALLMPVVFLVWYWQSR
ncbi:MAG: hypothetical protein M3020_15375 [Myxococcota bacterium]|nr:hypothetical protein [Myxococcota bacterium]